MIRLAKLQFIGPATVFLMVGVAELAAFALGHMPTSEALWYVNLKIFQVFQESSFTLQPPLDLPYAQFFLIALPLFAIATYGLRSKRSFPLALASHLSFVYAGFLIYCLVSHQTYKLTASITSFVATNSPNIYLPLFLIGSCMISFGISHYHYLRTLWDKHAPSMPLSENP